MVRTSISTCIRLSCDAHSRQIIPCFNKKRIAQWIYILPVLSGRADPKMSYFRGCFLFYNKNGSPNCLFNIIFELSNQKNKQNDILEAETIKKYLVFLHIVCVLGGNGCVRLSEGMYRGVKDKKICLFFNYIAPTIFKAGS